MVQDVALVTSGEEVHAPGVGLPVGLVRQGDGIFIDMSMSQLTLVAAINEVFHSHRYFSGLDYKVLIKALYGVGPEMPGKELVRIATDLGEIPPERVALYKPPKLGRGYAEYYFETLYLEAQELSDGTIIPERPTRLNVDEFVTEMWNKGILFGIEVAAVAAAIASTKPDRITVAIDLDPQPGQNARVEEVSSDLHRSDAPKERADGRVDLGSFQNRFPQIEANVKLLKKIPAVPGLPGYDTGGRRTAPDAPQDLTLSFFAGEGTEARMFEDGEYVVSTRKGFLNVDAKSKRISITDKIISLDGVSGKTTGNLELAGAYEEFGDIQEQREVTGSDITVHGNVYGNITSRGGSVVLGQNLVSGAVHNASGNITISGVASGSVIHTDSGQIVIGRAENCVISGTSVTITDASNCEIIAETVRIELAEGCAVAARDVEIDSAGPRRRTEMLVHVLVRDVSQFDQEISELGQRETALQLANAEVQQKIDAIAAIPDVRRYLALAQKLRNQELQLSPEQGHLLRKIAGAVATELQSISTLRDELRPGHAQLKMTQEKLQRVIEQKLAATGHARCCLRMVCGETMVRTMPFQNTSTALIMLPAKDIKQRLRNAGAGRMLFCDSAGVLNWHLDPRAPSIAG